MQLYLGTVIGEGKIIDPEFKIHIPTLMPNISAGDATTEYTAKSDRIVNKSVVSSSAVTGRNYILATAVTDYASRMEGVNVFEMERVDGTTEVETTNIAEATNAAADFRATDTYTPVPLACLVSGAPHPNHVHRILQPMKFYQMKLTNVNNIDITEGTLCLVGRIGSSFFITRFVGVIPQDIEDYDYEKQ